MKLKMLMSKNYKDSPFTKTTLFDDKNILVFEINLKVNEEFPFSDHEGSSLLLYAISGKGIIEINNDETEFEQGSLIYLAEDELFKIKNNSPQVLYCFMVLGPRPPIKEQYNELGI